MLEKQKKYFIFLKAKIFFATVTVLAVPVHTGKPTNEDDVTPWV
jgi:hypothetical protein